MSAVEKLQHLQLQLHRLRAQLPELLQRLSSVDDRQNSRAVFCDVVRGVGNWYDESEGFIQEYEKLKPLLESLRLGPKREGSHAVEAQELSRDTAKADLAELPTDNFDYTLGDFDGINNDYFDLT